MAVSREIWFLILNHPKAEAGALWEVIDELLAFLQSNKPTDGA